MLLLYLNLKNLSLKRNESNMKKVKKIISHLKGDIETFKHEAHEDRELIKDLKKKTTGKPAKKVSKKK